MFVCRTATSYVDGAIYQIKYLVGESKFGPEAAKEINTIAHAHVLTMDADDSEPGRGSYCGVDVDEGSWDPLPPTPSAPDIDYACQQEQLFPALNAAKPGDDKPMNFIVRTFIRSEYDPQIDALQKRSPAFEKPDIKLNPNFEDTFTQLEAAQGQEQRCPARRSGAEPGSARTMRTSRYLERQMKNFKFADDELVREGFNEVVEEGRDHRSASLTKFGAWGSWTERRSSRMAVSSAIQAGGLHPSGRRLICFRTRLLTETSRPRSSKWVPMNDDAKMKASWISSIKYGSWPVDAPAGAMRFMKTKILIVK